jgi:hypothetical protein
LLEKIEKTRIKQNIKLTVKQKINFGINNIRKYQQLNHI